MNTKKWIAAAALVVGVTATVVSASAWGGNANVHTACDVVVKVLGALGLLAPVSVMGGASSTASGAPLKLVQPDKEQS